MSRITFLFCFVLFSSHCLIAQVKELEYTIHGKLSGLDDGTSVILFDPFEFDGYFEGDTSTLLNGEYQFKGSMNSPHQVGITYLNSAEEFIFWLDSGSTFLTSQRGRVRKSEYLGSSIPTQIDAYNKRVKPYNDSLTLVYNKLTSSKDPLERKILETEQKRLDDRILSCAIDEIVNNSQSYYSAITLVRIRHQLSLEMYDDLFKRVQPFWPESYAIELLRQFNQSRNTIKIGEEVWDFVMIGENGTRTNIKQYKGRYVYLDFWASYCAPCLIKMPHLDTLQERSDSKKFLIVTLSLDTDSSRWEFSISKHNLRFHNYILPSNDPLLRSKIIDIFQLQTIPQSLLLGPDMKVILISPSDEELEDYLNENELLVH